ncbi:ATP-binding protein [Trichodesmium erythraeum]|uniref:ATP-binding protein n=1 Tax=Trichodesmium erythraeum TaxID=1206 RepID=UPI0018C8CAE1
MTKPRVNVEELKEHSPHLRDLNQWYRQNTGRLGILTKVFYETKPMGGVLVVNEDSADPGITDVHSIAVPADHVSIAKAGKNDLVYVSTIRFCEKVFTAEKNTQVSKSIPENFRRRRGAKRFVGRDEVIRTLHEQLRATEMVAISSVSGMAGIGKTEVALQYAYFHWEQSTYAGGICWLECRGQNVGVQIISFAMSEFNFSFSKDDDL